MNTYQLVEGEKGIAIRRDRNGMYQVIECTIETGFHGTRRYGSSLGSKYKTETGAQKSLMRWINGITSYNRYKNLGIIDHATFSGEEI